MKTVQKLYLVVAVVVILAGVSQFSDQILSFFGASPAWNKVAGGVPIACDVVLLACVLVLLVFRFKSPVQRQQARREGRTVTFYVGSIVALIGLYFAGLAALLLFVRDAHTLRIGMLALPAVIGIGYSIWYRNYARKAVARYDAGDPDVFL
jgi:hypothetical protein